MRGLRPRESVTRARLFRRGRRAAATAPPRYCGTRQPALAPRHDASPTILHPLPHSRPHARRILATLSAEPSQRRDTANIPKHET
ncbi:unnamed protein product [Pieris macdunnoughi]|uniref:Uncharacterized protein n=1 Tax=Pieris macdunnoughi TaxID=345717 RepID=A0A821L2I4_9NEOP|nr:unnamed protein product [Pieris macdunnoughi]